MDIETYVLENFLNKIIKYHDDGKKYILEDDIEKLTLTDNEKTFISQILKKNKIEVKKDFVKTKNSSQEVSWEEFDSKEAYGIEDDSLDSIDELQSDFDVEQFVENSILTEEINKVLETLTQRERQVVILRFGLDGGSPKTEDEVAKIFHVTKERILHIEARAMRKLRHPSRSNSLKGFLGVGLDSSNKANANEAIGSKFHSDEVIVPYSKEVEELKETWDKTTAKFRR